MAGAAAGSLEGSRYALRLDRGETAAAADVPAPRQEEVTGYIHSYETGGTLDGPGIRFVAFLTGCQLRCLYCHNPDTWRLKHGRHVTVDEVMAAIEPYAKFLIDYRGGVTFSGGEVLVQDCFVATLLRRCKELGPHTALDTNGYLGHKVSPQMMADTDLWPLDLKSFDPATHKRVTGVDVAPILAFARRLSEARRPTWIRFVLVPGLTDAVDNVDRLADFVASLRSVDRVEVLPFHKMGEFKWAELGLEYQLADTPPPSRELLDRVCHQFAARGLRVV